MSLSETVYLSIDNPCNEDWNKMSVVKKDTRFCNVCNKCVIDFSEKSPEKINMVFNLNDGNVCGNFGEDQLFQNGIPSTKSFLNKFPKSIAASVFGLFVFTNNSNAQTTIDSTKTEQAIDTIKDSEINEPLQKIESEKEKICDSETNKKYVTKRRRKILRFTRRFPFITTRQIRGRVTLGRAKNIRKAKKR